VKLAPWLVFAAGCSLRGCSEEQDPVLAAVDPSGRYGHETATLTLAASGDSMVACYRSLYDDSRQDCACLLRLQQEAPGRWMYREGPQPVELVLESDTVSIRSEGGGAFDFGCCGTGWSGDRLPRATRRPLGSCRALSPATSMSLPVPTFDMPEEVEFLIYQGDRVEGLRLAGAFDEWVLGRFSGQESFAGLFPAVELDCDQPG